MPQKKLQYKTYTLELTDDQLDSLLACIEQSDNCGPLEVFNQLAHQVKGEVAMEWYKTYHGG